MKTALTFKAINDLQAHVAGGKPLPEAFTCGWLLGVLGAQKYKRINTFPVGSNYEVSFEGIPMGTVFIGKDKGTLAADPAKTPLVKVVRGNPVSVEALNQLYVHSDVFGSTFKPYTPTGSTAKAPEGALHELYANVFKEKPSRGVESLLSDNGRAHVFALDTKTGATASVLSLKGQATLVLYVESQKLASVYDLQMYLFPRTTETANDVKSLDLPAFMDYVKKRAVSRWVYEDTLEVWMKGENNANNME